MRNIIIILINLMFGVMLYSQNASHNKIIDIDNYISNEYSEPAASNTSLNKIVFGYHPYWAGEDDYKSYDYSAITHLAYFSYEIDTVTGGYVNLYEWQTTPMIEYAHERNVKVVLVATNFGIDENNAFLADTNKQNRFITEVISLLKQRNGDGINMDLESVSSTQTTNLVNFMRRLYTRVKAELPAAEVSIATPAVDWSGAWDFKSLAYYVDYFMIMCYDYYWPGAPNAGPVSPLTGETYNVTNTINTYLKDGVQPGKMLMGVPWYGVVWQTANDSKNAKTLADGKSYIYSGMKSKAESYGRIFDEEYKCPWFKYTDNGEYYQGWYDDSLSLALKYGLVNEKNLLGIGIWAINYANNSPEIWNGIKQAFAKLTSVDEKHVGIEIQLTQTDNTIYIQSVSGCDFTFEIIDLFGRVKANGYGTGKTSLDISDYLSGIYFCSVKEGNERSMVKFVVVK
jgi:spore germination protein